MAIGGSGVVPGQETLDHAWVLVDYANGVQACLGMVLFAPSGERVDFELIGDKGRIALDVERQELVLENAAGVSKESTAPVAEHFHPGSRLALEDFVRCALEGGTPRANMGVGVEAAVLALAAEQAVAAGRPVTMRSPARV
jgi:predicted dehydrogenase